LVNRAGLMPVLPNYLVLLAERESLALLPESCDPSVSAC
jgi:hypothetical protein